MKKIFVFCAASLSMYANAQRPVKKDTMHFKPGLNVLVNKDTTKPPPSAIIDYTNNVNTDAGKTKAKTNYVPAPDLKAALTPICIGMVDKTGTILSAAGIGFDVSVDEKSQYIIHFEDQSFNTKDYALFVTMINASTAGLTLYVLSKSNPQGGNDAIIRIEAPLSEGADYYSRKFASVGFNFVLYKFRMK